MHVIHASNVNTGLAQGLQLLRQYGIQREGRGGTIVEAPWPVATVYDYPWQRVLLDAARDANPFFHLMEAIWILGGRDDVAWLAQFNARMAEYSDDGVKFHGAYGDRLRHAQVKDQLQEAIERLRTEPGTRQVVLQIWDAVLDLNAQTKDLPCNVLLMLKIRAGVLRTTVVNRSNDIIWGLYGANAVQFSLLHEYLAAAIGVNMGPLTHFSDSFHAYTSNPYWRVVQAEPIEDPYAARPRFTAARLITSPDTVYKETERFLADPLDELSEMFPKSDFYYRNPLFRDVAIPMYEAWKLHKSGHTERARNLAYSKILSTDWALACYEWLARREGAHGQ